MGDVLLIDVDSTIPNLALMKISSYYKSKGHNVELKQLNVPYYPNRKKVMHNINTSKYYKVVASAIFNSNHQYVNGNNIIFGGTGFDPMKKLPNRIEEMPCDYNLYKDDGVTYDFITRGCVRNCYFCYVPKKEGYLHKVKDVSIIIKEARERGHGKIVFLDNNILSYDKHIDVLKELVDSKLKIDLNQGLDFRFLTKENQKLLSKLRYQSTYIFAFDDWKYKKMIDNKRELLQKFGDWKVKLYLYINPNMELPDTVKRIEYCKEHKYHPYIMRDISCWESEHKNFYTDLAAYCNQAAMFKKLTFEEFLNKRHTKQIRINNSLDKWKTTDKIGVLLDKGEVK